MLNGAVTHGENSGDSISTFSMNRGVSDSGMGYVSLNGDEDEEDIGPRLQVSPPEDACQFATEETHDMLILWLCPCCDHFKRQSLQQQLMYPRIRWNPFYWFAFYATWLALYMGLKIHGCFGQASPVSDAETVPEKHARVHWIYTTTGGFATGLIYQFLLVLYYLSSSVTKLENHLWDIFVAVMLYLCIIFANILLIYFMQKQSLVGVRCLIVTNIFFSLGLAIYLVVLIVDCATTHNDAHDDLERCPGPSAEGRAIAALMLIYYVGILSFFLVASWVYSKLWNKYKNDDERTFYMRICQALPFMIVAGAITWLMVVSIYNGVPLWQALGRR